MSEFGRTERHESSREPKEIPIQDALEGRADLESASETELAQLAEKIELMILEVDPTLKPAYRQLLQKIRCLGAQYGAQYDDTLALASEYTVRSKSTEKTLRLQLQPIANYAELGHLGIEARTVDRSKSKAYLLCITDEEKGCWINLKFFKAVLADGSEVSVVYIADRYVIPQLRGEGLGSALLQVAEGIARGNQCSAITGVLVPENPGEAQALQRGMEKAGFSVTKKETGEVIAKKMLPY